MLQKENKRWNKRFYKEHNFRKWFRMSLEDEELSNQRYKLGEIKLDVPRWIGWKCFFVLRDDVKNRADAKVIQKLLDKYQTQIYSKGKVKEFLGYDKKHNSIEIHPSIKSINQLEYNFLTQQEKSYFRESYSWEHRNNNSKKYIFQNKHFFKEKIKSHYQTHIKIIDPIIESRQDEIRNKFWFHEYHWVDVCKYRSEKFKYKDDWDLCEAKQRIQNNISKDEIFNYEDAN